MKAQILQLVLPLILAPLTVALGRLILNARTKLDELPAWAKQGTVLALSIVLVSLETALGAKFCPPEVPCTLENFDQSVFLNALMAFALHNGLKKTRR